MEAVLCVQNLCKRYPGFALENVSFSLASNRIMGLIGKNGAGKSTTLKSILRMVSPESGKVEIFQKDFSQCEKACKQRMGVVFGGIDFSQLKFLYPLKTLVFPAFSPPRFGPFPSFFPLREEMRETFFRPSLQPYPAALRKFAWPLWWRGRKCSSWYLHQNVPATPAHPWVLPREREGWSYMYASTDGNENHPYPRFSFGSIGIRC